MTDADSSRTPLSQLLAAIQAADHGAAELVIPDDWLQGRAIYGGLSAALCLQSVLSHLGETAPLRSAQLAFISPAGPGVRLVPSVLRQGKSATFAGADLCRDDGGVAARATFCFGKARDSKLAVDRLPAPDVPDANDCSGFFEDANGVNHGPNFARHFDSRRAADAMPMSGASSPVFTAWMRHRDRDIASTPVALAALGDALPPAAMAMFETAAPVSSMTWQFELLSDDPTTEDGWWLSQSRAETIGQGYASQAMTIWNHARQPILVGRQSVAVFY
ncbi:thioesterase family protein [uncultured Salinisphaera sp.]|uniref:thioesterase family protein n=1 Tax=uncultured Salinisphaera sp. TaxID=359372 RepID=UPI0032B1E50A|tara:strand:- start:6185 stop:7012 length:828 start_codon:yes stop_codon:yes gene_type:complete